MTDTPKTQSERPSPIRWSVTPKGKNPAHIGANVIHPDGSVGVVVGGQNSVTFGGKQAACIGDKVECPGHTGVIIQGAKSVSIGGKSLAREGDKTSCGGVIMNGFPSITVFDAGKTVHGKSAEENTREIAFRLTQSAHSDATSYVGMPYVLSIDGQEIARDITDETGTAHFEVKKETKECMLTFANGQSYILSLVEAYEANTDKDQITNKGIAIYSSDENELHQAKDYLSLVNNKE